VKAAFKYQRCRKWIQIDVGTPFCDLQANLVESKLPYVFRPIIVGQGYALVSVADPIHEAERVVGKDVVHGVIFQNDHFARDAPGFSQKSLGIIRMMKNVDETHDIETIVCGRKMGVVLGSRPMSQAKLRVLPAT
jgi:hypothetical protein